MAIRVLILDGSEFFRRQSSEIISFDNRLTAVGADKNGQQTIEQINQPQPDVVDINIEMPIMDAITAAVKKIMDTHPALMRSSWSTEGTKHALEAPTADATNYLLIRFEEQSYDSTHVHKWLRQRLIKIIRAKLVVITQRHIEKQMTVSSQKRNTHQSRNPIKRPDNFLQAFAQCRDIQCKIQLKQAKNGDRLHTYLTLGETQSKLKSEQNTLFLDISADPHNRPYKLCINVTLPSITEICPQKILGIVQAGKGADSWRECQNFKQSGATSWAQDDNSSTILGTPKAMIEAHLADEVFNISHIGKHLSECK